MVEHNLEHGVITLGWGWWITDDVLTKIQEPVARKQLVKQLVKGQFPEKSPGTRGHITGRIWRFCIEIKDDDLVVLPLMKYGSDDQWIAIGNVQGPAWIDQSQQDGDTRLRRKVTWLTRDVTESAVPEDLRRPIKNRQAVVGMPDHAPQLLHDLCGHGMEALSGDEAGVVHHGGREVPEGAKTRVEVNKYERDSRARRDCIEYHGATCKVCGLDFEKRYGAIGHGFIHVHHTTPLSQITDHDNYTISPVTDLVPVCPNCHAMLHKSEKEPFTVKQLQHRMTQAAKDNRTS